MRNLFKIFAREVSRSVVVLIAIVGIAVIAFAFTEPSAGPTGGTVYAPVNIGNVIQTKQATLIVSPGNFTASIGNLTAPNGQVWATAYCNGTGGNCSAPPFGGSSQWTTSGSNIYYNAGNVGISATAPSEKLDIAPNPSMFLEGNTNAWGFKLNVNDYGSGNVPLRFIKRNSGVDTEVMRITQGGNVGIGTASPSAKLTIISDGVNANFRVYDSSGVMRLNYGTGFNMNLANSAGTTNSAIAGDGSSVSFINALGGNVGIGTGSPAESLDTGTGIIRANGYRGRRGTGGVTTNVMNTSWTGSCVEQWVDTVLQGTIICASDARIKTNIQSLGDENGLVAISRLNPVTYNWKDSEQGTTLQFGFTAQDVELVFPELVRNTGMKTDLTPDGMLTIDKMGLLAPAIKAIQELDARTQSQQKEIDLLKAKIDALEKK